jgi:hypothetical protein
MLVGRVLFIGFKIPRLVAGSPPSLVLYCIAHIIQMDVHACGSRLGFSTRLLTVICPSYVVYRADVDLFSAYWLVAVRCLCYSKCSKFVVTRRSLLISTTLDLYK